MSELRCADEGCKMVWDDSNHLPDEGCFSATVAALRAEVGRKDEALRIEVEKQRRFLNSQRCDCGHEEGDGKCLAHIVLEGFRALATASPAIDPIDALHDQAGFKRPERVKDSQDEIDRLGGASASPAKKSVCCAFPIDHEGDCENCSHPAAQATEKPCNKGAGFICPVHGMSVCPGYEPCDVCDGLGQIVLKQDSEGELDGPCPKCQPAAPEAPKKERCPKCGLTPPAHQLDCDTTSQGKDHGF